MNMPEHGHTVCSFEEYEEGKQFIVKPDRLCIDAIYTFAVKPFRSHSSDAYLFTSKVVGVEPQEDDVRPYIVSIILEEMYRPGVFESPSPPFPSTPEGLIAPHPSRLRQKVFDEAYLRHKHGSLEAEMTRINDIKTVQPRVMTVPTTLPLQV